jgi:hypothetical protein
MNVEIGAEAANFPEKEYINGIAFAVYITSKNLGLWHNVYQFVYCCFYYNFISFPKKQVLYTTHCA